MNYDYDALTQRNNAPKNQSLYLLRLGARSASILRDRLRLRRGLRDECTGNGYMTTSSNEPAAVERVIELRLPSRLGYEKVAMDTAASLARRMGFISERVEALRTAVAEAVTNAIEHGNAKDLDTKVSVVLTLRHDELVIDVSDQGLKTLDTDKIINTPRIEDALARADKGGWGIWLIRELMDEVEFSTGPTGGNQIRMVIHLEQ